jgi:hypothetical protein
MHDNDTAAMYMKRKKLMNLTQEALSPSLILHNHSGGAITKARFT